MKTPASERKPAMNVHAPYNFVPLSSFVHFPAWGKEVSHDVPFEDGYCGTIDVSLENHTLLLIGGEQNKSEDGKTLVDFCRLADGRPYIPGTSLKGLIRNVIEIAAFGKMNAIDDTRLSVRDLTDGAKEVYRVKLNRETGFGPKSKAGWLQLHPEGETTSWQITPCKWARVDQDKLVGYARGHKGLHAGAIKKKGLALAKYQTWGEDLELSFSLPPKDPTSQSKKATPEHLIAVNLGKGSKQGRLVFTGQPQENRDSTGGRGRPKYLEFIFYDQGEPIPIDDEVMRGFLEIHAESKDWKDNWRKKVALPRQVPVFYITEKDDAEDRRVRAIGLAMMFRLAYTHSLHDMVRHSSSDHFSESCDLAELMFGTLNDDKAGLRGRVGFTAAKTEGAIRPAKPQTVCLSAPKPGFYPSYAHQPNTTAEGLVNRFMTCMDADGRLRGWKRYPVRDDVDFTPVDNGFKDKQENNDVLQELHPLSPGHRFRTRIRLHNLKREELGALIWALTLGGDAAKRHGLGMGKPFGMGAVSFSIEHCDLVANNGQPVPTADDLMNAFTAYMTRVNAERAECEGATWLQSNQLTQLLAMADPNEAPGQPGCLKYLALGKHKDAKGPGTKDPRWALLPYKAWEGPDEMRLFPPRTPEELEARARKRAEAEAREQAKAKMTPLQQEMEEDLVGANAEERAGKKWLDLMESANPEDATAIANRLRAFFEQLGKWHEPGTKKQKAKNERVRRFL